MLIIIQKKIIHWKVTVKKDIRHNVSLYLKTLWRKNENILELIFCVVKSFILQALFFWWTSLKSGSYGVLIEKLESISKY